MSNTATLELLEAATAAPVVIKTPRGPCLADRPGLTIYPVLEYLKQGYNRELIQQDFRLTGAQLDAMQRYIAEHEEEVERAYAEIVRRSEALQARYQTTRSLLPPDMPWAEKDALLRQELARRQSAALSPNEHHAAT